MIFIYIPWQHWATSARSEDIAWILAVTQLVSYEITSCYREANQFFSLLFKTTAIFSFPRIVLEICRHLIIFFALSHWLWSRVTGGIDCYKMDLVVVFHPSIFFSIGLWGCGATWMKFPSLPSVQSFREVISATVESSLSVQTNRLQMRNIMCCLVFLCVHI